MTTLPEIFAICLKISKKNFDFKQWSIAYCKRSFMWEQCALGLLTFELNSIFRNACFLDSVLMVCVPFLIVSFFFFEGVSEIGPSMTTAIIHCILSDLKQCFPWNCLLEQKNLSEIDLNYPDGMSCWIQY